MIQSYMLTNKVFFLVRATKLFLWNILRMASAEIIISSSVRSLDCTSTAGTLSRENVNNSWATGEGRKFVEVLWCSFTVLKKFAKYYVKTFAQYLRRGYSATQHYRRPAYA
jgi:hypothetical protein